MHELGEGKSTDVFQVLSSAKVILDTAFGSDANNEIWVYQNLNRGNPIALFERGPNGEYKLELSTTDRYWAKYVYQFSHEYCHVRTNYERSTPKTQWFEEVICELCSIYTLRKMAAVWAVNPPYSNWQSYSEDLVAYADERIDNPNHQLPAGKEFSVWFQGVLAQLEADPYLREKNTTIAIYLLPLFEQHPSLWVSLSHWNKWDNANSQDIFMSFKEWVKLVLPESVESSEILIKKFRSTVT